MPLKKSRARSVLPQHFCVMAALLLLVSMQVLVQAWAQAPREMVVKDIRVEGLQRISEGTVFNYLPVNIGDTLDQRRVQEALRAVYSTEFFKDVEIRWDRGTLVIAVLERPSIESFTISGNEDIKTEDLEESLAGIGLRTGRILNRSVLEDVEQSLTEQYFSQGKYAATVSADVEELPGNKVSIAINITEGERARIRQINIVGNRKFSDDELLEIFELRTPNWLSWFRQDDRYSREALSGDLEALESYYMDRGFADFAVESTQVAISPDKKDIFITINLLEGDRYVLSDIRLAGDLILPEDQLNQFVLAKPGQIFSQQLLTRSSEFIRLILGEQGYAFATVEPVPELNKDDKTVSVVLYVDPKNRVYVRRINFDGAASVNDEVFRREMRQFEGGYLSNARVERSKIRLQRLRYIDNVEVETNPVPGYPDLVDIDFNIEEGLPGQFGGGIGYSDSQKLLINGNFVHENFLGSGNRIAADINTGRFRTIYSLSHTNPYATLNEVSRTVGFAYRDITQFTAGSSDFSTKTLSASLEYSYPITEFQRLVFGVTYQASELLADSFGTVQSQEWVLNNGDSRTQDIIGRSLFTSEFQVFELALGWIFDSRNRGIFADRGARHRVIMNATVPGSEVEYYTVNYNFKQYVPLTRWFTLSLSANLGFGEALGETTALPPYKNYFAGGPNSVRGYKENRLGPKDSFGSGDNIVRGGNPYGGNLKTVGQVELILPIPAKWRSRARFTAFYDVGNVFSTGGVTFYDKLGDEMEYDFDANRLKQSVGIAAEWLGPLGLFRFSYGFPLNKVDDTIRFYGDQTEQFQFSIGGGF